MHRPLARLPHIPPFLRRMDKPELASNILGTVPEHYRVRELHDGYSHTSINGYDCSWLVCNNERELHARSNLK
jgi:hypothetical protein